MGLELVVHFCLLALVSTANPNSSQTLSLNATNNKTQLTRTYIKQPSIHQSSLAHPANLSFLEEDPLAYNKSKTISLPDKEATAQLTTSEGTATSPAKDKTNLILGQNNIVSGASNVLVGDNGRILGDANAVNGSSNVMIGSGNIVKGQENLINGQENESVGGANLVKGTKNKITGDWGQIVGASNQVTGTSNKLKGNANQVNGLANSINGDGNLLAGSSNKLAGQNNRVSGSSNSVKGYVNSLRGDDNSVTGQLNVIKGDQNTIVGDQNTIIEIGDNIDAMIMGLDLKTLSNKNTLNRNTADPIQNKTKIVNSSQSVTERKCNSSSFYEYRPLVPIKKPPFFVNPINRTPIIGKNPPIKKESVELKTNGKGVEQTPASNAAKRNYDFQGCRQKASLDSPSPKKLFPAKTNQKQEKDEEDDQEISRTPQIFSPLASEGKGLGTREPIKKNI